MTPIFDYRQGAAAPAASDSGLFDSFGDAVGGLINIGMDWTRRQAGLDLSGAGQQQVSGAIEREQQTGAVPVSNPAIENKQAVAGLDIKQIATYGGLALLALIIVKKVL